MSKRLPPCWECDAGELYTVRKSFTTQTPDGSTLKIPKVKQLICAACGDMVIDAEGSQQIESAVEAHMKAKDPAWTWRNTRQPKA